MAALGLPRAPEHVRAQRRRQHDLAQRPTRCYRCDKPLAPDSEVWRIRVGVGYSALGSYKALVLPFCRDCGRTSWGRAPWLAEGHCGACGRPVVHAQGPNVTWVKAENG